MTHSIEILIFIIASSLVTIPLFFSLRFKNYRKREILALLGVLMCYPVYALSYYLLLYVKPFGYTILPLLNSGLIATVLLNLFLVELARSFLYHRTDLLRIRKFIAIDSVWIIRLLSAAAIVVVAATSWAGPGMMAEQEVLHLRAWGTYVFIGIFFSIIYLLYMLEMAYRHTTLHFKRIGRIFFLACGIISVFHLVFVVRVILLEQIPFNYLKAGIGIGGVVIPAVFIGLLRLRVGSYEVALSRESIYSSITLFICGAILLGLGIAVYALRQFGLHFDDFELFFAIFTLAFFGVLALSSEQMRMRIRRFANRHVFQRKYDYRNQFFRLHQTYMAGDVLEDSIATLVNNLKYAMSLDDVFVYTLNEINGNFDLRNATIEDKTISGDGPLAEAFNDDAAYLNFSQKNLLAHEALVYQSYHDLFDKLHVKAIFPIRSEEEFYGFVLVCSKNAKPVDEEDISLIEVFTVSIGNVFFRYKLLKEHLEQKQFESFNHVASFIIHDIKNQVGTLSLLTNNARKNINNPDFQKSLLRSLESCTAQLKTLVAKLSSPPKEEAIEIGELNLAEVIHDVLDNSGLDTEESVIVIKDIADELTGKADAKALFFILKNLVTNALEAIDYHGTLSIHLGACEFMAQEQIDQLRMSTNFISSFAKYIIVEDNGRGMSEDFVQTRLFHPFSSTKDKGIGIGLYQCKSLVEKMHGALLCTSELGIGTKFCILLK
ncbi:MAG: hypothetical protein GF398_21970 [Chitinivibrionales bacterium]|nr:hypothetical protein [Chitinivibrionales bacterium]